MTPASAQAAVDEILPHLQVVARSSPRPSSQARGGKCVPSPSLLNQRPVSYSAGSNLFTAAPSMSISNLPRGPPSDSQHTSLTPNDSPTRRAGAGGLG
jgi:hypothetical protein